MKNFILLLSVLFFIGCKKENNLSGTYNRVGTIQNGVFIADTITESFTFISDNQFISTNGNGNYTNSFIYLNGKILSLRIESRMIYIDTLVYFN